MNEQKSLFDENWYVDEKTDELKIEEQEISALDEMFAASRRYRNSREYMDMLKFISRFPQYSPFNCMLLNTQNPSVSYVATAGTWARKFKRYPRHDARPLVILAPMSPVLFVYDLKDTEGDDIPVQILRPFVTEGNLKKSTYEKTVYNSQFHKICIRETLLRHPHAGSAIRLKDNLKKQYHALKIEANMKYLILINKEYNLNDKYSSLAHELAHIFCGHIGDDDEAWWKDRTKIEKDEVEIEAESVAFLVCQRKGLYASSDKYLSNYRTDEVDSMPFVSINAIFQATSYIEDMGRSKWEKPKKVRPKKKQVTG